ncbi:MAG: sulfatase [Planctomycetaceae bacterium]|nr:sulfatase [Planctomycetaceae bacterium]
MLHVLRTKSNSSSIRVDKRNVASVALCVIVVLVFGTAVASAAERPNVVWIIADDLSPELGCYGYKGVSTPNMDRLAADGRRYLNAFATAPVCSSSRSALITSVTQIVTGTHQHRTSVKRPLPEPVTPLFELMRRSGYFVCNGNSTLTKAGKTDYNFEWKGKAFDGVDWTSRQPGQPFFAQVQIKEPHRDFVTAQNRDRAATVQIPSYYPEHPVVRADWANYLQSIEVLDQHVGRVLDRLDREGLTDNTVVFFFGDHGRPHYRDKQWLYDGGLRVPLLIRWPGQLKAGAVHAELVSLLDVTAATLAVAGEEIPQWMEGRNLLDENFHGRTEVFAARDRCGNTVDRIRCIRTDRFKLIRNFHPDKPYSVQSGYKVLQYPGLTVAQVLHDRGELVGPPALFWADRRPEYELYDVVADPDEVNNLADDLEHATTLADLQHRLYAWIEASHDQGALVEPELEATITSSEKWYAGRMKQRGLSATIAPAKYLKWWEHQLGLQDESRRRP